jgi:hypothetical protein
MNGFPMVTLQNISFIIGVLSRFIAYIFTVAPAGYFKAWVAQRCGDNTAADNGYMTLDPLVHFDPFGIITLIFLGIGWGKNIPVNLLAIHDPYRRLKVAITLFSSGIIHIVLTCIAGFIWVVAFDGQSLLGDENSLVLVAARIVLSFMLLNSFLAVITLFINAVVLISLLVSEKYASFAQQTYYVILFGPLALLILLELMGIPFLAIVQTFLLQVALVIGTFIAHVFYIL